MNEISLCYVHKRSMGYGRMGVDLAAALAGEGVKVWDDQGIPPDLPTSSEVQISEGRDRAPGPTNVVCWLSTPAHARWWFDGQYRSMFTMWEANVLPPAFRDTFHEFDLMIVPSEQNRELFSKYHPNVRLNPLGVDPARWHFTPRPEVGDTFRFLIGGSGKRKGTDLAFKAFRTIFKAMWDSTGRWTGSGPEPRLVMKNPRGEGQYQGWHGVEMISGRLSDEEEETLYSTCHAYIQPSRGEGFGLQPLQAMAQGMPTILTDAHGHSSFAKYATHPIGWSLVPADYFIFGDAGEWWEPDFEELCESMWDLYHNYDPHRMMAEATAKHVIASEFTWQRCAQRFIDAHEGQLALPYAGKGEYEFPDPQLYRVRVTHAHEADIAGAHHIWLPGKDYYEVADVKRLLFEANRLDPECIEGDDHGLAPQQVAKIGAYSAAKEWCPTCHQRLGTRETLADHYEAQA